MEEKIPRRLMRFYREKPTEEEVRAKSSELSLKEVDSFREKHDRYPDRKELDVISQNVFDQLKRELEKADAEAEEIYLGEEEKGGKKGKTVLELRKEKRKEIQEAEEKNKRSDKKGSRGKQEENATGKMDTGEAGQTEGAAEEEETAFDMKALASEEEVPQIPKGDGKSPLEELEELEKMERDDNVKKLASIDELSKLEKELSSAGDFDLVEKEVETTHNNCPRCSNKAVDIVYCPNCGDAFCDHCAKKVEVQEDAVKYTCPKCNAEFRKRKPRK